MSSRSRRCPPTCRARSWSTSASLVAGNAIRVSDISLPEGVEFKSDPDTVVAPPREATTMEQIEAEQAAELEAQGLTPVESRKRARTPARPLAADDAPAPEAE